LENHLLPLRIHRLLQDNGKEYTTHHLGGKHKFKDACKRNSIKQTFIKVKHPWTNGYVERFNLTLLEEFYQVAFRKKVYHSLEELQRDLDESSMSITLREPKKRINSKRMVIRPLLKDSSGGKTCALLPYSLAA
jgi:hypothetical protein